jgi:TPP-dependent pyruvate/acetoin dehydrogenase alpha subunit
MSERVKNDPILGIEKEKVRKIYEDMLKIRIFETREEKLKVTEQDGAAHSYRNEEAIATGVCSALNKDDYITSTHRGHGHLIAKGGDMKRMMAELYGKVTGYSRGKGGSMHIADFNLGILGANGIVSGGIPISVGAGYSAKLRGSHQVVATFFGDGAMNQGGFHEAANLANAYLLPVVFVCEVNHWQCGVRYEQIYRETVRENLAIRAQAYGMPGEKIDGNDVVAVYLAAKKAIEHARSGKGPYLLACYTYRIGTHFIGDIEIRPKEEIEYWEKFDPIPRFEKRLLESKMMTGSEMEEFRDHVTEMVEEAVDYGRKSSLPDPKIAVEDVYVNWPRANF